LAIKDVLENPDRSAIEKVNFFRFENEVVGYEKAPRVSGALVHHQVIVKTK
jgi:hypothetical protein